MDQLIEFGIFFAKAFVIVVAVLAIIAFAAGQAMRNASQQLPQLEIERVRKKISDYSVLLKNEVLSKKELKKLAKDKKKKSKGDEASKKHVYVIDFDGDIKASQVKHLRDEVSIILEVANKNKDEVVVRVNSPGGAVHTYGLAAAQLDRIKKAGFPLTVSVDKVAASGGYMMACTADKIIASPFAILGSIGVIAQVPNFHRLLKDKKVDYEEITAGDYKRTVSLFGEITDKGRKKFTDQIEDTHELFKDFVSKHRPKIDISKVGTGEYWFGIRAKELNLVDEIVTSDEYFSSQSKDTDVVLIKLTERKKLGEKIGISMANSFDLAIEKVLQRLNLNS